MSISSSRDHLPEPAPGDSHDATDLPPALAPGFVIGGKYQVKRVLGMGGNGAVYDCEHTEVGHRVAVKVAHHKLDDRGDVLTRFRREARTCGSLRHPHVGQVFDVGTLEDGAPYMVLELLEGRSLADVIDDTTLPIAATVHIARQLLAGLAAAHQSGVIHLDIKPDNVMLVRDHSGEVVAKLVDFGISRRINEVEPEHTGADEGFVVGSPDYMPVEQLRGEPVDTRTDVYATGVLLYEALTGRTPFDSAATVPELVEAVMHAPVPPPSGLRADCPIELERVVLKAMSRDPNDRYASAEAMSRALAEVGVVTRTTPTANLDAISNQSAQTPRATTQRRRRTIDERMLQTLRIKKPAALGPLWMLSVPGTLGRLTAPARGGLAAKRARAQRLWIGAGVGVALCALLAFALSAPSTSVVTATTLPPETPVPAQAANPAPAAVLAHAVPAPRPTAVEAQAAAVEPAPPAEAAPPAEVAPPTETPIAALPPIDAPEAAEPEPAEAPTTSRRRRAARARRANKPVEAVTAAPKAEPAPAAPPPPPPPPEQDPALTRTQLLEAEAAFNNGQDAKALKLFRQLVKVAPRTADAWRGLAASANRMAERSEAERALRRYLTLRPKATDAAKILQLKRL